MNPTTLFLQDTLTRLRSHGWKKGSYGPTIGPNCTVGALRMVEVSQTPWSDTHAQVNAATLAVARVVVEQYADRLHSEILDGFKYNPEAYSEVVIVKFNDHDDTDFPDIERVIEKAVVSDAPA